MAAYLQRRPAPSRACIHSSMPSMISTCDIGAVTAYMTSNARLPKPAHPPVLIQTFAHPSCCHAGFCLQSCSLNNVGTSTAYDVNGRAYYVQVCQRLSIAASQLETSKIDCCIRLAQSCMRLVWHFLVWAPHGPTWHAWLAKNQCSFHSQLLSSIHC
jgi:hypothetical protein